MRKGYSLLIYLFLPFITFYLLWRNRKNPHFMKRAKELFGFFPCLQHQKSVWIHAASLGEVNAALPLINFLKEHYPSVPLLLTTQTMNGSQRLLELYKKSIDHVLAPLDYPFAIKRFLRQAQPRCAIFMETEIWPNKLYFLKKMNIPLIIANARLTERTLRGYQRFHQLRREMVQSITHLIAQSDREATHYQQFGVPEHKIFVAGNMKFDINLPENLEQKAHDFHQLWGKQRLVWIAASTHEGEETIILDAYQQLKQNISGLLLILVPRHSHRFDVVAEVCSKQPFKMCRRSQMQGNQLSDLATCDIFLIDTMGELLTFYACAHLAFVGGSLIDKGCHNLIEPSALGLPVITGPYIASVKELHNTLSQIGAAKSVTNAEELIDACQHFLQDLAVRQRIKKDAKEIVARNRGAVQRHMQIIENYLE